MFGIFFSITSHLVLYLFQLLKSRQVSAVKLDERNARRSFDILSHYVIVWISVMTSPRSFQLDFWLLVIALMDLAPLVYAIGNVTISLCSGY
jgi:hypothetical protein